MSATPPAPDPAQKRPPAPLPADEPPRRSQLGETFVRAGVINPAQLEKALEVRRERRLRLGQALVALGFVTEAQLLAALRAQGKLQTVHLTPGIVDRAVAGRLGHDEARRHRCLPLNRIGDHVTVAMEDPSDVEAIDALARLFDARILPVFAEPTRIDEATAEVFREAARRASAREADWAVDLLAEAEGEGTIQFGVEPPPEDSDEPEALDKPVINLVKGLLEDAYVQGVSDIHLEPQKDALVVRFRIDGTLFHRTTVPKAWARPVLARLKVLADLDIAQRRLPQDGRISFRYDGQRVDLRLATTPTLNGEGAVLRLLDGGRGVQDLAALDLDDTQREALERAIDCRDGFVLATGPTGSGKTTTLYAMLARLAGPERKVITLEDPVENEMPGITQINANAKIGLTFAAGLRSILRQDPDVVLVGEVRDQETAEIAVQASMTGHLVLSTLHTVGAAESVARLADMGVEPYLLADTLRAIVAQRLVRRICTRCRREEAPDPSVAARLGVDLGRAGSFYVGAGCDDCKGSGYRGRAGIYEVLTMSPALRTRIARNAPTEELEAVAREAGVASLRADGLRKAAAGVTTLQEVLAATVKG